VGVPLIVYTLAAHAPDTPVGVPEMFAPVALDVLYFISSMAEPAVTVWLLLAEVRVMAGGSGRTDAGLSVASDREVIHVPAPKVFTLSPNFVPFTVNGGVPFKSYPPAGLITACGGWFNA
jgi:hypothetical protein